MKKGYRFLSISLAVLLSVAAFGGCGPKNEGTSEEGQGASAPSVSSGSKNAPETEEIRIAMGTEVTSLDNQAYQSNYTVLSTMPCHQMLITYDENNNFVPGVAEEWGYTDDTHFTFRVRKGMKFHNGREVTAQDVKDSIERVMDLGTGSKLQEPLSQNIQSVNVTGEYTGEIVLKQPYAALQDKLTWIAIIPIETADQQATAPVGCGPYRFVTWNHGIDLVYEKFDDFWNADQVKTKRLIIKFFADRATERSAMLSGELDAVMTPDTADYPIYEGNPDFLLVDTGVIPYMFYGMNCTRPPFDNKLVRQAVMYAVDRQKIVDVGLEGYGSVLSYPIAPSDPLYDPSLEYDRDVAKAKALLAQAGYPDGIDCSLFGLSTQKYLVDTVQPQLEEAGIHVKLEIVDRATYYERLNGADYDLAVLGDNISPDPDFMASTWFVSGHFTSYTDDRLTELAAKANASLDVNERKQYYTEFYRILQENAPIAAACVQPNKFAISKRLKGYIFKMNMLHDFSYCYLE